MSCCSTAGAPVKWPEFEIGHWPIGQRFAAVAAAAAVMEEAAWPSQDTSAADLVAQLIAAAVGLVGQFVAVEHVARGSVG